MTQPICENPKCDFCSAPDPTWWYPARSFTLPTLPDYPDYGSVAEWAACDFCHDLIEAGDRKRLSLFAAATFIATHDSYDLSPEKQESLLERLSELHEKFWSVRTGAAQPITVDSKGELK